MGERVPIVSGSVFLRALKLNRVLGIGFMQLFHLLFFKQYQHRFLCGKETGING